MYTIYLASLLGGNHYIVLLFDIPISQIIIYFSIVYFKSFYSGHPYKEIYSSNSNIHKHHVIFTETTIQKR